MRWVLERPESVTNPIRKDRTRAYGSYYLNTVTQLRGSGSYVRVHPGTQSRGSLRGAVCSFNGYPNELPGSQSDELLNDARMAALGQLSGGNMQFNVAAVEARNTMGSCRQFGVKAARGLGDMWHAMKHAGRGSPRSGGLQAPPIPKKQLGELANQPPYKWKDIPGDYLGYLYGLRPIADDIANGLDRLGNLHKQNMSYGYSVRSTKRRTNPIEVLVMDAENYVSHIAQRATILSLGRVRYDYRFPQWWIENTPIVTPFSEAWELTRLSFVLDWVLPVNRWVGAMESAQFDPYFHAGWETRMYDVRARGPFAVQNPSPYVTVVLENDSWSWREFSMRRTALTSEQRPTFRTKFPSFRNYLGVTHAAQALSLATQMLTTAPNSWGQLKGPRT